MLFFEEQQVVITDNFSKEFSISPIEVEKIGLNSCFKKVKEQNNALSKSIDELKLEIKNLAYENQKLNQ